LGSVQEDVIWRFGHLEWNAMIWGHVQWGQARAEEGIGNILTTATGKKVCGQPDSVAFCGCVECMCASVVALLEEEVRSVHEQVIQSGCKSGVLWWGVA
jgi:hypothetical protein